jgi:hypothetical protein
MPTPPDLEALLTAPREILAVEHKSWLDLSTQHGRATLAKAMIAMANHGGGTVVIGTVEAGAMLRPEARPVGIAPYTPDSIAGIVKRFADPPFEVTLDLVIDPRSGIELAVVGVAGGSRDIVLCKSGTNDGTTEVAVPYMRKPGPESAAPRTVAEWRTLLDRCVQARRAEMLDAIRAIVAGSAPAGEPPPPDEGTIQTAFVAASRARWEKLISPFPLDSPARLPRGRWSVALRFSGGSEETPSLQVLRDRVLTLSREDHSGWPPFAGIDRKITAWEDGIEAFMPDDADEAPHHADYWRVTADGRAYLIRGFIEDGRPVEGVSPGTGFDIVVTPSRLGEVVLWATRFAAAAGRCTSVDLEVRVEGLANRRLVSRANPRRHLFNDYVCRQDAWGKRVSFDPRTAADVLPEIVHPLISPLYTLFGFFELPDSLVAEEISHMRNTRL